MNSETKKKFLALIDETNNWLFSMSHEQLFEAIGDFSSRHELYKMTIMEKAYNLGRTEAFDEAGVVHGEDAERFIAEMKKEETNPNPARVAMIKAAKEMYNTLECPRCKKLEQQIRDLESGIENTILFLENAGYTEQAANVCHDKLVLLLLLGSKEGKK